LAAALALAGVEASLQPLPEDEVALTDFEEKYRLSGHHLWRLTASLGNGAGSA